MLFMVLERFLDAEGAAARFRAHGRLIPEGRGVAYVASWMTPDGARCFQVMEAPTRTDLDAWIENWSDLVEFEVREVVTSAAYWAGRSG